MQIHPFGRRSGFQVPRTNIGAMRLPGDVDQAVALIRQAIDAGMRYIDTSRGYGDSEVKLGKALKNGYREKVILSTKWSPWITRIEPSDDTSATCVRKRIEESMHRLQVDYLDFYQVWNIDSKEHYEQAVAPGGMIDGIRQAREDGLVGHIGCTSHDSVEHLVEVLPEMDWCEVILVSYNLLNTAYAPVIHKAHELGIGVIIMNPVGGGRLAQPSSVLEVLAAGVGANSVPDLAIRYQMSNPGIDTILSGISKPGDVTASVRSVEAGAFNPDALKKIENVLDHVAAARKSFCTGCAYCMPCPQGIDIPGVMSAILEERLWGMKSEAISRYRDLKGPKADECIHCGTCEEKCPQHLDIMDEIENANLAYGVAAW